MYMYVPYYMLFHVTEYECAQALEPDIKLGNA